MPCDQQMQPADTIRPKEPQLLHHVDAGVATVVIHHPAKRNALTTAMWQELPPLLARLAADPQVRALVLTGEGPTFSAGADITSLRAAEDADAAQERTGPQQSALAAEDALAAFPWPSLAVVRGHCVGGGCQLAAACDLRFADETALFGVTPAKLGIVYPPSSTRRLVRLVGPATTKYLLFSGELIDAARALRTGLVDEVLPPGALGDRVAEFTRVLVSRSRLTQAAAKEFTSEPGAAPPAAAPGSALQARDQERAAYWAAQARSSGETAEGVAAFLERRAPRFGWPAPQ